MIKYLLTYIVIASTLIYAKVNESFTLNHSDNSSFSIQFDIMEIVELTSIDKVIGILKNKGINFNDS